MKKILRKNFEENFDKKIWKKNWEKNYKKILRKNFEENFDKKIRKKNLEKKFDKKILIDIITRKIPRGVLATRVYLAWDSRNTRVSPVGLSQHKCLSRAKPSKQIPKKFLGKF